MTRIALVTGASRGIGRAIALRVARDGFRVWANYAGSKDAAEGRCAEIEAAGGSAVPVQFDVAGGAAATAAIEALIEAEAAPDAVV